MEWTKTDPEDGVTTNLNVAYMDASDEKDFTAAINSLWHRFELGYIYAHNKIDKFNSANYVSTCDDGCWISNVGDYDIHTIHASYLFPNVMDMKNFNIYLGAYASWIEAKPTDGDKHEDSATAAVFASNISSDQSRARIARALVMMPLRLLRRLELTGQHHV